jgi:hypothetical protein
MGQPISVAVRVGASPSVRLFACNRSITGMDGASYQSVADTTGPRPPDVLARRLFDLGATGVSVFSSDVTVEAPAPSWTALETLVKEAIENLFGFYGSDAGWSDEALRELGVEPAPRPEPSE